MSPRTSKILLHLKLYVRTSTHLARPPNPKRSGLRPWRLNLRLASIRILSIVRSGPLKPFCGHFQVNPGLQISSPSNTRSYTKMFSVRRAPTARSPRLILTWKGLHLSADGPVHFSSGCPKNLHLFPFRAAACKIWKKQKHLSVRMRRETRSRTSISSSFHLKASRRGLRSSFSSLHNSPSKRTTCSPLQTTIV